MNQKLVQGKFGHGGRIHSKLHHKIKRWLRPTLGKASIPFNWKKGLVGQIEYPIKNQFQSMSCWGQAFSRFVQIQRGKLGIEKPSPELSAKSAYSPIYAFGGGVELSAGENEAKNIGLTLEMNVPSTINGSCNEQFMEDTSWRTLPLTQDCLTRANLQVVNVPINLDSIAEAIRDYGAVIFLFQGQDNGLWTTSEPVPPTHTSHNPLWGHYVCSSNNIPPTTDKKLIKYYNSWGNIGDNGFQYFDENYINSGYILDCFTFIVAAPTPTNWWANFLNLIKWLRNNQPKVV